MSDPFEFERASFKRKADDNDSDSRKHAKTGKAANGAGSGGGGGGGGGKMSFAQRMMAKMGYKDGEGLGKTGEGILNPIEVKLRPQGAGVGAVKEKTDQAKKEAKRQAEARGEQYEDSSEEERKARKKRKEAARTARSGAASGASTPGGFKKAKTRYQTAADIEAAAEGLEVPNVLKSLIDATGKENRLLTSTVGLMTPSGGIGAASEAERIAKRARLELEGFAEAWNDLVEKKKFIEAEEQQLVKEMVDAEDDMDKARTISEAVDKLNALDLNTSRLADDALARWDEVTTQLERLQADFTADIDAYGLSDVAVAVIHPLFKQEMLDWDPLEKPMHLVEYLKRIVGILRVDKTDSTNGYDDVTTLRRSKRTTTSYESLIHSLWLPRVRTAITNEWDPHSPTSLLTLIEAWSPLLPPFVRNSLINNIIEQKLSAAIKSWSPRTSHRKKHSNSLPHTWLFPWLPYLSDEHTSPSSPTGLLADVKRKLRVALDTWDLEKGVLPGLSAWQDVMRAELDRSLISHLLPRLASYLSTNFSIDPSDQDMKPLETILLWTPYFRASVLGQLLITEFFPKWHNILHLWLTGDPNFEEVGQWFTWWKTRFPEEMNNVKAVEVEWERGLEMINTALDLGKQASTKLPLPAAGPARPVRMTAAAAPSPVPDSASKPRSTVVEETTFKDVVENWCSEENLLLIPLREAHEQTGLPLFRITASATGKGGVIVYFKGDVVWAAKKGDRSTFEPTGLGDALVARSEGK